MSCVRPAACSPVKKDDVVGMKRTNSRENLVKPGSRRGSISSDTAEKTPTTPQVPGSGAALMRERATPTEG